MVPMGGAPLSFKLSPLNFGITLPSFSKESVKIILCQVGCRLFFILSFPSQAVIPLYPPHSGPCPSFVVSTKHGHQLHIA
eukprot:11617192-Karenia_brevis.AAC.1